MHARGPRQVVSFAGGNGDDVSSVPRFDVLPNESRPRMDAASNPGITTPVSICPFKYEYQFLI
jgi:hypothetical protein